MVRLFLVIIFSFSAHADFFGFGGGDGSPSKIPALVDKLKGIEMEANPSYEEAFSVTVKSIENAVEEEKLFCAGEAADAKGRVLPKDKRQLCFRELKTQYIDATDVIFNLKKKYLTLVNTRQIDKLSEIQKNLKAEIEKSF